MRELAASLGIAITGAILAAREGAALANGASHATAFVNGYQTGLYLSAAVMTAGAALALVALRHDRAAPRSLSLAHETTENALRRLEDEYTSSSEGPRLDERSTRSPHDLLMPGWKDALPTPESMVRTLAVPA